MLGRLGSGWAVPELHCRWGVALPPSTSLVLVSGIPHDKDRAGRSYSGEVWTDGEGRGVVLLPPFVHAHRAGFDYELTPIGARCSASVVEEIADGRFTVATDAPHVKVAWRVTALRERGSDANSAG
jgi:hypothetical protein